MSATKIEWATHTENYLAGCTKVSPACTHCYAESMTARLATMPNAPERYRDGVVDGKRWTGRVTYSPERLRAMFDGLRGARSPRRVFVNSMSDTFHDAAPPESLEDLAYGIVAVEAAKRVHGAAPHVIMLLTKRPANALAWQRKHFPEGLPSWVWIGCTVENQEAAARRIPLLCHVRIQRGGVRFLSCEPLLGAIDLGAPTAEAFEDGGTGDEWLASLWACRECGGSGYIQTQPIAVGCRCDTGSGIRWVIAGGESGPKARPSHPDWFRSLRDQCATVGVPFHFKQRGEWSPFYDQDIDDPDCRRTPREAPNTCRINLAGGQGFHGARVVYFRRVGKKAAGRLLDGVEHNGVPSVSP